MPKLEMQVNMQPLLSLSSRLTRFKNSGLSTANLNVGKAVKNWIDSNFTAQGGLNPEGWTAYKNQTLVNRRLLEKSGRLRQNWHVEANGENVTVRSGVNYALAHHYGTKNLPARPLVPQGQTLVDLVMPVYVKALTTDLF